MQITKTHYYCDYCGIELEGKGHISIHIKNYAGFVKPPDWKHKTKLEDRPYQFCGGEHLISFLSTNARKKGRPRKVKKLEKKGGKNGK
jgi:hypothetical protein